MKASEAKVVSQFYEETDELCARCGGAMEIEHTVFEDGAVMREPRCTSCKQWKGSWTIVVSPGQEPVEHVDPELVSV